MNVSPVVREIRALLHLLDDETPGVRSVVSERLARYGGDLSEVLAQEPIKLSHKEKASLLEILQKIRRKKLEAEWVAPTRGAGAISEDWEEFEALLRLLSDFMHDGITLRQPLSDALDLLAEEAHEQGINHERGLAEFLFCEARLTGNRTNYDDPRNSDLAWSIDEGKSNPLGLSVIYMLVAQRLEMQVEGINFPGHFLCRISEEGTLSIVDCFDNGRIYDQITMLENGEQLTANQRMTLLETADLGTILVRLMTNLLSSLQHTGRMEDAALIENLRQTLTA